MLTPNRLDKLSVYALVFELQELEAGIASLFMVFKRGEMPFFEAGICRDH